MPEVSLNVKAATLVVAKMTFVGVASYSAAIYEPLDNAQTQWKLVNVLAEHGSSEDARPDEFSFDAPPVGVTHLFFFEANMTPRGSSTGPVKATAEISQSAVVGQAPEGGNSSGVPLNVVVRIQLTGVA